MKSLILILGMVPSVTILLLLVLGSILLWQCYLRKQPVLIIVTFVIGALLLQGLTLYQFYKLSRVTKHNLLAMSNNTWRREAFEKLLEDFPAVSILSGLRAGEIRAVTVDYNHPAELFFYLNDNLHTLTITREGAQNAPQMVVRIKSTTDSLVKQLSLDHTFDLSSPATGTAVVLDNDTWTCMVLPPSKDQSHFQLFVFDKPQTNDYTAAAGKNPEMLKDNPDLYCQLNITIQP